MNVVEFLLSTCRICLQDGATYPIFDQSQTGASIHSQLNKCFMEKIENVEGFPKNICSSCKLTLDMLCEFIDNYRKSSEILKESLVKVKTEVNTTLVDNDHDFFSNDDDFYWDNKEYVEIKVENINENLSNTNEILDKLKVPGLQITRVQSNKLTNETGSTTVKKNRSSKNNGVTQKGTKIKNFPTKKETVHERVKKLIETKEKEEKNKEKLPLLCDICGAVFSANYKLNRHIAGRHSDAKLTCSKCSKQYLSEFHLKLHMESVHSNGTFMCDQCSKVFKTKKILRSHIVVVHNKQKKKRKTFTCELCNKIYKSPVSMIIHERSSHTGLRPAVCTVCDKAFFHEVYLKEHMRLHTGELPFKCPFCERGYTQRGNMKSHLRQHKKSELNDTIISKMRPSYMKCLKNC